MWIKMKKNYPGNNKPIPGLERCSFQQEREYDLPDNIAKILAKTGYASKTIAPWERGINRPMIEVEKQKNEIAKLQVELSQKEAALQNAREISLTIPTHVRKVEALQKTLNEKQSALKKFAKENNIFLTKEAAAKAKADAEAKAKADAEAAVKDEAEKAAEQDKANESSEEKTGTESKTESNNADAAGQAAQAGQDGQ